MTMPARGLASAHFAHNSCRVGKGLHKHTFAPLGLLLSSSIGEEGAKGMLGSSVRTLRRLRCCNNSSSLLLLGRDCGRNGINVSKRKVLPLCCNGESSIGIFDIGKRQSSIQRWHVVRSKRSLHTETDAYLAIELALDSVVKIFTVSSSPNYFLPWQNKSQRETMGSGFVIPGKKILTNAHVVADHTFVLVRKHGSPTKYRAEVLAVGHECDLAILVVETQEFWEGVNFLELGDIPFLQEAVAVVGYPQGGDNISVTKGVVSRVEPTQYVHGATQLMAIQIDAAINPGNSGGPAIMGNKVAGVAFQNLSGAENIGYIIPVPVIKHFVAGVEESGKYVGFCSMGLSCQPTENVQLRNHFKMQPQMTGVLVSKINPLSDAHRVLKKDDIILEFDGVPIANDGTVPFRNRERITFDHLVSMKKPNETALVKVLRNGEEHAFTITLRPLQPLVPVHQFDKLPSYYIFAGLVFVPLTQPYLHEYGEDWYNASPRRLCERALRELPKRAGEQLVILSQVLMDDINAGYERLAELQVKKVNGIEIQNLKHLCQLVENCSTGSLRFDLDDDRVVALNFESARTATSRILERHRIPSRMSGDLVREQNDLEID
ncbi:protease Do-like 10, mitochondrial [Herrania umbratica]|uniref:Protease Do-like 10, mitochondrial n=1 Tax=Herrania umbratica TaxID=108875 RepID=A0A6J1BDV4_9ROSI|nr:protease Do-like 10, mitochondrial [Herrania umbratica]